MRSTHIEKYPRSISRGDTGPGICLDHDRRSVRFASFRRLNFKVYQQRIA
jgi:hypothetical protein